MRRAGAGMVVGLLLAAAVQTAEAAELVMFEDRGCSWCARFDLEIGPIYARTDEARRAPLRRVDLDSGMPAELAHLAPVRFTPTFVLLEDGREVGRIQGYPGEMHFWGLLGMLLERLPERAAVSATAG